MRVWKFDDGAMHWISARSIKEAREILRQNQISSGLSVEEIEETDDGRALTNAELELTAFTDEDGKKMSMLSFWLSRGRKAEYLACSEW